MAIVNQQLLAKKLKISCATVSRSLANDPAVSEETRGRVLQLAGELGYRVNRPSLRSKTSRAVTIGVLVGVRSREPGTATFPYIIKGIHERAALEHVTVDVRYQRPDDFDPKHGSNPIFRHIRAADWRGVILIYPFEEQAVEALTRKIPTVAALEDYVEFGVDSVDTDQTLGVLHLIDEVVALGHRRIGFVAWDYPVLGHWTARRFGAYMEGLHTHGVKFEPNWVFNVRKSAPRYSPSELGAQVARAFREDGVTAWICAADHQAYPLIYELQMRGIRVPDDCSVTGYDGIEPPAGMQQVATVMVPHEEIGASALARLLNRMEHPHSWTAKLLLKAQIERGVTLAPPRAP
jgi:LacI family transcriptional regulator